MKNLYYLFILSFLIISCEEEVPPITYTLTTNITPVGAGSVNPSSGTYDEGSSVTISATPTENYSFKQWTGTGSGTANPLTFKIISNTIITAEFELIDADGDGVADALDNCPDTPAGSTVNADGCATSQLDADGDGVADALDRCPDTPAGAVVDSDGCSNFTTNYNNVYFQCNEGHGDCYTYLGFSDNIFNFSFEEDGILNCSFISFEENHENEDYLEWYYGDDLNFFKYTMSAEILYNYSDSMKFILRHFLDNQLDEEIFLTLIVEGNALILKTYIDGGELIDNYFRVTEPLPLCIQEIDSDNDGVTDDKDQCSDTPEGETIDENGCSDTQKDSDGDGVTDDKDLCSDTPDGETVDENGCSDFQKDTDGDGVNDDKDQCPDTPENSDVNSDGCPYINLSENGVSLIASQDALIGNQYSFKGKIYTIVDNSLLNGAYYNSPKEMLVTTYVTDMDALFKFQEGFNDDISAWDVSNVTTMEYMFAGTPFDQDIGNWDVSNVQNMKGMFNGAENFNSDISSWDVSIVTTMENMFDQAKNFNSDISSWDVSNVQDMFRMFSEAENFNSDISSWDVSNVQNMYSMFNNAVSFNQDLSGWNISNVIDYRFFDLGANSWSLPKPQFGMDANSKIYLAANGITVIANDQANVGETHELDGKYYTIVDDSNIRNYISNTNASDLQYLVTTRVTDMDALFYLDDTDGINISSWDVSNVTTMEYMFDKAENFNSDISSWDVSNVQNMRGMFKRAYKFNQDLSGWDVGKVTECSDFKLNADNFVLVPNFTLCNPD